MPDVERDFPRIRVMGTIGWIASGLACGFLPQMLGYADISPTNIPLLITAGSSALLGVFAFFLPDTPPKSTGKMDIKVMLGLDALILLRDKDFLVFFFCSFLFAMPLAFYYIFANGYLTEVGMKNATGWMTLGQFSEIFFMLALPFFTKRFGIKKVLLLGLVTAAIRYGFFIYGSADEYFTYALLFLGILLHGVSYDFYYVTAYIYVDKKAPVHMRTAAQGLITLCCQGFGSLLGYRLGGVMMEKMFAYQEPVNGLTFNWAGMWTFGAVMIAIIAVLLSACFLIMIWRDITRSNRYRKELEEANKRAEALLEAREKLMLAITHDFKAPLGSIIGYTDLLTGLTTDERQRFYLDNMKSSSQHLLKLVSDLLDFHRLDLNKAEVNRVTFNPAQLFEEIRISFKPLTDAKHLTLSCSIDAELDGRFISDYHTNVI